MQVKTEEILVPKLMQWVNSRIRQYRQTINQVTDLNNGTAFLLIISKQFPNLIQQSEIILQPENNQQVGSNLRLLTATLEKIGDPLLISLAKKIEEGGDKKKKSIIPLALSLYLLLEGDSQSTMQPTEDDLPHKKIKAVPRDKLTSQTLIKERQSEVSHQDINQLHSIAQSNGLSKARNRQKTRIISKINKYQKPKTMVKMLINDSTSDLYFFAYSDEIASIKKLKQMAPTRTQKQSLSKRLMRKILLFLQTKNIFVKKELITPIARSIRQLSEFLLRQTSEADQSDRQQRIHQECRQLFRSADIIKFFLFSFANINSNLLSIKFIRNIQDLLCKPVYNSNFYRVKDSSKKQYQHPKQNSTQEYFWTQHLVVIIAIEIQYVENGVFAVESESQSSKKKQYEPRLNRGFNSFITKVEKILQDKLNQEQIVTLLENCEHLKKLFQKNTDQCAQQHQSYQALRKHITVMLDLKHRPLRKIFATLYDKIVGEVINVKIKDIQLPEDRFRLIDCIASKVSQNGIEIEESMMEHYHLEMNSRETEKLLKATVYCLLAELNKFPINEIYCDAFNLASINKGDSSRSKDQ